jgi:hypothetical protein
MENRTNQQLAALWHRYDWRWPVEISIRFRKQHLLWTLPRFQGPEYGGRWTSLVNVGQWQLFLARHKVKDRPSSRSPFV